jgi:hypothetical protein
MIRLPSIQKQYDTFVSIDPAILQLERGDLDDAAWAKAQEDHAHKLEVARETGDWSALMAGTGEPTKFTLRPVPGGMFRTLLDWLLGSKIGGAQYNQLLVRAALVAVTNLGEHKVKHGHFDGLGRIASVETTDLLDSLDLRIVNELAAVVQARADHGLSPKS